jgi:putative flippase GtrA
VNLLPRWLRFNAVGAIGMAVQLAVLALLHRGLHVHYMAATALAVEIAVLHNFVWHEMWTWKDRTGPGTWTRLLRFHLGNGAVSLAVNLGLMGVLVGRFHLQYLLANLASIAAGSIANFAVSNWLVFSSADRRSAN